MKYLRLATDILRMCAAIPLYLASVLLVSVGALFEYAADKLDVPDIGATR